MAQAVTFRAFGAENPGFDTTCVARVISIQSRFAEVEKTFAAKPVGSRDVVVRQSVTRKADRKSGGILRFIKRLSQQG